MQEFKDTFVRSVCSKIKSCFIDNGVREKFKNLRSSFCNGDFNNVNELLKNDSELIYDIKSFRKFIIEGLEKVVKNGDINRLKGFKELSNTLKRECISYDIIERIENNRRITNAKNNRLKDLFDESNMKEFTEFYILLDSLGMKREINLEEMLGIESQSQKDQFKSFAKSMKIALKTVNDKDRESRVQNLTSAMKGYDFKDYQIAFLTLYFKLGNTQI